jgi:2',3'-cyclic-nucleotide 2'-phosphodiesterase (5'-nucleotidase family)
MKRQIFLFAWVIVFCVGAFAQGRDVTILYTNDFHSAFDPIPAYWLKGSPKLGGAAHLATLANRIRAREKTSFFFDSGDMFTGQLSFLTKGEALMEMMRAMKYDALGLGNHEFDYGSENFERQTNAVDFPVLAANIFYKGTNIRYSRPYTIIEREGFRVGVIGIVGEDTPSTALPSGVTSLEFRDPIPILRELIKEIEPRADLIVVLAHEGKTGPMQTDAENRPEVQRDFDEDIRVAGAVEGIDVFVGGHAHRGIEVPYVHPKTGTIIVQTYGYGTRLGFIKLKVESGKVISHRGELLKVWSDNLPADKRVAAKIAYYKKLTAPKIGVVQGVLKNRLVRDYNRESSIGDFIADVMRQIGNAEIGMQNAGGIRADLPEGEVTNGNVYDALPFVNSLVVCEMTGKQIKQVLEQGFSLERGMIQVSGLTAKYDLSKPIGERLVNLEIGGKPADDSKIYSVATNSFIWEGGDLYKTFLGTKVVSRTGLLSEIVMDYLKSKKIVDLPKAERLIPVK